MMFRITLPRELCVLALLGVVALSGPMGCSHLVESKAIDQFTMALAENDLEQLRSVTSPQFEKRALRATEALDDFKILNLPKGEVTVVEVQESSDTEKLVTVNAGKLKKKLFYRLVKEEDTGEWVVDDLYVRQRKDGVKVDKSIAEQMDLLLNVREFLTVWDQGTREEVLSVATPELAEVLKELPPLQLSRLCKSVVSEHVKDKRHRPKAQLDSDVAVVTLPRKTGKMILSFKLFEGQWRVNDVAVESKVDQEHIPSVMKTATVMRAAIQFLDAYNTGDKSRLKPICHPKFYEGSIVPGDLSSVPLPSQFLSRGKHHVKMQGKHADFVIEDPKQVVKIGLTRDVSDDPLDKKAVYQIDEVTVYQNEADDELQEMRLSMVFTGQAVLQLFRESLVEGNLPLLRKTATQDFNSRVWQRIEEDAMAEFTPRIMTNRIDETISSDYDGALCRITVKQMGEPVTYVLRDRNGLVAVDDVVFGERDDVTDSSEQLASMKESMELMIPLRRFREALAQRDLDALQRTSSTDLNRMIWKQADKVPDAGQAAVKHLKAPLNKVQPLEEGKTLVTLGSENFGCSVLLVSEHDQRVVDDIVLVAGVEPELRARFKRKMREQLAFGAQPESPEPDSEVRQAAHWENSPKQRIQQAMAQEEEVTPLPEQPAPAPLPPGNAQPVRESDFEPQPAPARQGNAGQVSPPLFPRGEEDLESIPEIKPDEDAFETPAFQ